MALEVVAVRRDGYNGDIDLTMEGLPAGVTATGLKIPAGQSRGVILVTARPDAPRGFANANFVGRGVIDGATVERPCRLASMAWPIRDAWGEIPRPRLLTDVPVSVGGVDQAPLTIAPTAREPLVATVGQSLTIPLTLTRRSEFSGATMQMRALGAGFEGIPQFDVALTGDTAQATVDLAKLKTAPGDYVLAFHGGAVAKYRHRPDAVSAAEAARQKAMQEVMALEAAAKKLTQLALQATPDKKPEADKAIADATARLKAAAAAVAATENQVKAATAAAAPQEIVDIIVTEPIVIRVKPAEAK